jgi:hypothetical protein
MAIENKFDRHTTDDIKFLIALCMVTKNKFDRYMINNKKLSIVIRLATNYF